jgi:pyruvate,water dikinase
MTTNPSAPGSTATPAAPQDAPAPGSPAAPGPLPTPPTFPVTWNDPQEAGYFWFFDRMHAPEPAPPADAEFFRCAYDHGITAAAAAYELPLRAATRRVNTYMYLAQVPLAVPPDDAAARGRRIEAHLDEAMAGLGQRWRGEFLPEIQQHLAEWEAFDAASAPLPELLTRFAESITRTERLYEIHMLVWYPMMTAISSFDDLFRDLFDQDESGGAFGAYRLLQGIGNKTVEGGHALWRLGRRAVGVPPVRAVLEERAAADVPAALEQTPEGRDFLADFRRYLEAWGQRGDRWGWSYPTWIEDPTPVIKNLKDYVAQPDRDLDAELAALAAERERLVAAARERLRGYPRPVVDRFEFLLAAAQQAIVLTEDHTFWIDFRCMWQVRRVYLELGRRLAAASVLDRPDDVFLLTPDEVRTTAEALPRMDRRRLAAARRAELAYFRTITPPPVLGTPPSGPPPTDPVNVAIGKFFGAPPEAPDEPGVLRGTSGSPGTARGPARVVRSLAEAGRLQPGDVLVAETTAPPWTPLFATAAAIVTDTGGVLSHCAVVAREYGIPAVVGTGTATASIEDGQLVEVDGDAGLVRLV